MDKNKFSLGGRLFNTASPRLGAPMQRKARSQVKRNARHVRKLGAPTQRKARQQVGCPNAHPQRKWKARQHVRKLGAPMQCKARPQVGRPNATQGEFARWAPKRKTHPQRKRPHKGALHKKTRWRMDKNKFWLGGRLFNTASPRLGPATQTSASWAPQRVRNANATQGTCPQTPQRNARHVCKMVRPNAKLIRNENVHTREH
jgi:hypothetical protein